jgi:DNA polymerase III subunit epsilon
MPGDDLAPLTQARFAAIDFESAGDAPGMTDVPIQIGIALMTGTEIEAAGAYRSFLAAARPVAFSARKVHGISDEMLAGAPPLLGLWPEIRGRLEGRIVVAHAAATEKRYLRAFPSHEFGPWLDTLTLARRCFPGAPSYALGDLLLALGLAEETAACCPGLRWHDALFDATACLVLVRHIIRESQAPERSVRALLGR